MAAAVKSERIEDLIAKADQSLLRDLWFEAERLAGRALTMARQETNFDLMIRAVSPLWNARRERLDAATARGSKVTILNEAVTEDMSVRKGIYLVQPPLVGADARRLRLIALAKEVPVLVLCREPLTKMKQTPIVAVGTGSTLRVRIGPPEKPDAPDKTWMLETLAELGNWAVANIDLTMPVIRRVDLLLDYLDALPEHEGLHHALEAACAEAMIDPHAGEDNAPADDQTSAEEFTS